MAHYAFIDDNNIVREVITGIDEDNTDDLPDGFDSWEGLPEEWFIGGSTTYRKGDMNVDMPDFPDNIKLYKASKFVSSLE